MGSCKGFTLPQHDIQTVFICLTHINHFERATTNKSPRGKYTCLIE